MREQLEGEVNHLTQLLQEALRKQDEMALEAADAWQKVSGGSLKLHNGPQGGTHIAGSSLITAILFQPKGAGQSSRAGGHPRSPDVKGEREPEPDFQAGRVPGCRVSAQAAGGESRSLREGEEQAGESLLTLSDEACPGA